MKSLTLDALKKARKEDFKAPKSAESSFNRALRKIAKYSAFIVEAHVDGARLIDETGMMKALREYSQIITPWAAAQSKKMIEKVMKANQKAFKNKSQLIAAELKTGVAQKETGKVALTLMNEQVALIKSLPIEAGLRAQKLAMQALYDGSRADEIAKELMRTEGVTQSRATLIAVTETARANAAMTQARAQEVGAIGYIWRTTMDGAERPSHRKMNGKFIAYADGPPTLSDGTVTHAGSIYRCRCFQEPVFAD